MIYVCVATKDNASTVGLLLWKVRQVFSAYPREYQILVADDASTDATDEVLERYQRVLPMTVLPHRTQRGYAATVEALLREALRRTDRPKRDTAVILPPDFAVSPEALPELLRRMESGADLAVGETLNGDRSLGLRLVRRSAPWLLRPGIKVPGVRDVMSGFCALRLVTLDRVLKERRGTLLDSDGICARAELVARLATTARRVDTVPIPPHPVPAEAPAPRPLALALELFRAGRRLRVQAAPTEPQPRPAS